MQSLHSVQYSYFKRGATNTPNVKFLSVYLIKIGQ